MQQGDQMSSSVVGTTFSFRRRWAQIDWRSLASIDVDRIAHDMDVKTLQQNIMNVTFCNVLSEEFHNVDPNFTKLFRLAQLIIEYLLFTQQYLSEQATACEEKVKISQQDISELKDQIEAKKKELVLIKKENRKRRKIIEKYQQMLNAGATGLHSCPVCRKEFISGEYLQSHITRRHPNQLPVSSNTVPVAPILVEPTPPHVLIEQTDLPDRIDHETMKSQIMEQLNQRLMESELQIKESLSAKEFKVIEQKLRDLVIEKQQEQERTKVEFQEYRSLILNELHQQKQETEQLQDALQSAQDEFKKIKQSKRVSHLGRLEGAEEIDLTGKKTKEEVTEMKNHMQSQFDTMSNKLKKQKKKMKEKMEKLSETHEKQLSEYAERIKLLETTCQTSMTSIADKDFKENIETLQKRLRDQEQILSGYDREISELKSSNTAPVKIVMAEPLNESLDEVLSSEESETNSSDVSEETTKATFVPFKHRPYITSNFDHDPAQLERFRQVLVETVNEGMKKRGLGKSVTKLSHDEYEEKLKLLEQDRQVRVNTHYNFNQHGDALIQQVDEIIDQNYEPPLLSPVITSQEDIRKRQRSTSPRLSTSPKPHRKELTSHVLTRGAKALTTPPTTPTRQQMTTLPLKGIMTTPPATPTKIIDEGSSVKHVTIVGVSPRSGNITNKKPPVPVKGIIETKNEEDSLTELSTEESSSLELVPVLPRNNVSSSKEKTAQSVKVVSVTSPVDSNNNDPNNNNNNNPNNNNNSSRPNKENSEPNIISVIPLVREDDDSPWDSDEDDDDDGSVKNLATPTTGNIFSSTPIKQPLLGLDPSKRPVGGVPVMVAARPISDVETDDSDTFTLSEHAPPPPKQKDIKFEDIPTIGSNNNSKVSKNPSIGLVTAGSSRSALTTVTIDDDFDSDLSDLSVIQLT